MCFAIELEMQKEKSVQSKMENEPEKHVIAIQRVKYNRFIGNEIHLAQHRKNEQEKKHTHTKHTAHGAENTRKNDDKHTFI